MIMMMIMLFLIKLKTHAFIELKAFIKKTPVSLFFDDGKFLDMKASPVDTGLVVDKDYGVFIRHQMNTYLGKRTRNVYDVYDCSFSPGVNISAAKSAQELKKLVTSESDYQAIGELISKGDLPDEHVDCIRSNISLSPLKDLYNYVEPHNINASVEKKVARNIRSLNKGNSNQILLTFLAVFGALLAGYILLKIFQVQ